MRHLIPLVAVLLTVPGIAQQQCWTTHAGEPLNTNVTMGGPNLLLGMKVTAPASINIAAIQVQTGLRAGPGSMAVWSHDALGDQPGQPLGPSGAYQQSTVLTWQGAALPTSIPVAQGQIVWLVWGMPNSSRSPQSTTQGGTIPYRGSFDGGQTWNGAFSGQQPWPAQSYKLRIFCDYPNTPIATIGQAKAGAGGIAPSLSVSGWPVNGNELDFILENAAPTTAAVLAIGVPQTLQLPGLGSLYVGPLVIVPLQTSAGRTPGTGTAVIPIPLPGPGVIGFQLATQFWVVDPGAAGGLSHTAGVSMTIQ